MSDGGTGPGPRPLLSTEVRVALGLSAPEPSAAGPAVRYTGVSTDTRTLRPGDLFVTLRGEHFDGVEFLEQAARGGAPGAVVPADRELPEVGLEYFRVEDPLTALGRLATHVRVHSPARVVGITGSSGKTTVKEMIACAVSSERRTHRTAGNLNNQIGLPLTILRAPADAEVWVLEMGASEPGEISRLTAIARPDDAVITTVGPAHLELFGDETTVLREKLALVEGASMDGFVVVGERPAVLPREALRIRPDAIVAGLGPDSGFRPERCGVEPERIWFEHEGVRYEVPVGGEHHLRDALIAAAVAEALGVSASAAARGLAAYRPVGLRSAVSRLGGLTLVADCYNANPESFRAAIDYCRDQFPERRLAAFVGSMLELGEFEAEAHREIATRLVEAGFELIAATGAFEPAASTLAHPNGTRLVCAAEPEEAWEPFATELRGDEVVLVKASRGARLERIVERLESRFGEPPPAAPGPPDAGGE